MRQITAPPRGQAAVHPASAIPGESISDIVAAARPPMPLRDDVAAALLVTSALVAAAGLVSPETFVPIRILMTLIVIGVMPRTTLLCLAMLGIDRVDLGPPVMTDGVVDQITAMSLGGKPFSVPLVMMVALPVRGAVKYLGSKFQGPPLAGSLPVFAAWVAIVAMSGVSSLKGITAGNQSWTTPLRLALVPGVFWFGAALRARRCAEEREWRRLSLLAAGLVLAAALGLYRNHAVFLFSPVLAVIAVALWRNGKRVPAMIAAAMVLAVVAGTVSTFAMIVGVLLSLAIAVMDEPLRERRRHRALRRVLILGMVGAAILPLVVSRFEYERVGTPTEEMSVQERFLFKIFLDRAPLWKAAEEQVAEHHGGIAPAGEPLPVRFDWTAGEDWTAHCHNAFLEMARWTGYSGVGLYFIVVSALWLLGLTALGAPMTPALRAFVIAAAAIVPVGMAIGVYPVDFFAGPWVWMALGAGAAGVGAARKPRQRPKENERRTPS